MNFRVKFAWIATISWILFWVVFIYIGRETASALKPNEWGDFFSGISAPLAFLWLVVGYFQQGDELNLNTRALLKQEEALQLQVQELKQSVDQQKELVKVTQEQLDIDKANAQRVRDKEKEQAYPRIRMQHISMNRLLNPEECVEYRIVLANNGHDINRIGFLIINSPKDISLKLTTDWFDSWDYSTEKELIILSTEKVKIGDSFELHLDFIDSLREVSSEILYFTGINIGYLEFSLKE